MSKPRTRCRSTRRLAVEQMESRLLLAGDVSGPVVDSSFLNHDSIGDYAVIANDSVVTSSTPLFSDGAVDTIPRTSGAIQNEIVLGNAYFNNSYDVSSSVPVPTSFITVTDVMTWVRSNNTPAKYGVEASSLGIVGEYLPYFTNVVGADSFYTVGSGNTVGSLIRPLRDQAGILVDVQTQVPSFEIIAAGSDALTSFGTTIQDGGYQSHLIEALAAVPRVREWQFISSFDLNSETMSAGLELETNNVSDPSGGIAKSIGQPAAFNLDADGGATIGGQNVEAVTTTSEGGMIAVGRVMAELRGESTGVQVAAYVSAKSQAGNISAGGVSGELARAVAFERIEGTGDEVATFPVALALRDDQARFAATESRAVADASDAVYRPELASGVAGHIRMASYVATRGEGVDGRSLEVPMECIAADWSGEVAALDTDGTIDEARHEVFSRWESAEGESSRLASLADRVLSWPVAGAVAAVALGHFATSKRVRERERESRSPARDSTELAEV